eukprot:SAG22_NODE_1174_length_5252_cov_177.072579_7_plen_179_part_00
MAAAAAAAGGRGGELHWQLALATPHSVHASMRRPRTDRVYRSSCPVDVLGAQGESVGNLTYDDAMAMIGAAGRPLLLTFRRAVHRDGNGGDGGPVLIEGDLLKLEPNLFASIVGDKTKEAHRRYFVVRADHVTYQRAIGSEVILHFSMVSRPGPFTSSDGVARHRDIAAPATPSLDRF